MNTIKKILRFFLILIASILSLIIVLINWPKGSIESQMEKLNVPAFAYGIIEDGAFTELEVIGELEKGRPAQKDAIFNVASITKPVFSLVMMKLIANGSLGLDEPLHSYWVDPDIKDDPRHRQLTPRLLMSHQGGFSNWRWNNENGKLSFNHDPGTQYQYSGEGMEYLRIAVESKLQMDLVDLADSLLFQTIGMEDSRFIWDSLMDERRFAKWHNAEGEQYKFQKRNDACAADDLMTTVRDLGTFAQHIFDHGGLPADLYEEMIRQQVTINERTGYGLGWEVVPNVDGSEFALVHGGSDMGVRARLVVMPESKRAFIGIVNGDQGQKLIDRTMVKKFDPGKKLLSKIYLPVAWRIIHLPFNI